MKEDDVIAALAALAQETRLRLFRLLVAVGPEGLPAGRIAEKLGATESTLSFHLSHLRQAGLIRRRRDGRSLIYSADFATMTALLGFLTENCCGGRPELCCPPTELEASYG
ncbi:MAG: metalloregulator ArsR/SmtB family transcription factor [Alphaproteobacteria bacterium]